MEQTNNSILKSAVFFFISIFVICQNNIGQFITNMIEGEQQRAYFYHWNLAWFQIMVIAVPLAMALIYRFCIQKSDKMVKIDMLVYIIEYAAILFDLSFAPSNWAHILSIPVIIASAYFIFNTKGSNN